MLSIGTAPPLWMHPIEPGRGSTNAIRKRLYGINRNKLKIIKKIFKDNKHLCVQYGNFNLLLKLLLNPTEQLWTWCDHYNLEDFLIFFFFFILLSLCMLPEAKSCHFNSGPPSVTGFQKSHQWLLWVWKAWWLQNHLPLVRTLFLTAAENVLSWWKAPQK